MLPADPEPPGQGFGLQRAIRLPDHHIPHLHLQRLEQIEHPRRVGQGGSPAGGEGDAEHQLAHHRIVDAEDRGGRHTLAVTLEQEVPVVGTKRGIDHDRNRGILVLNQRPRLTPQPVARGQDHRVDNPAGE